MRRGLLLVICALITAGSAAAQDGGLAVEAVEILPELDIYGQEVWYAEGLLVNRGEDAYTGITLLAEVYDAADNLIGEGFGYPVNACLAGLLPDFALQPGASQPFATALELYEGGADAIFRVDVLPQAETTAPQPDEPAVIPGIMPVTRREVVSVEWIDAANLRYGVGCWRDLFAAWDWYEYNLDRDGEEAVLHPRAEAVANPAMLRQIGLTEPLLLNRSFLTFDPGGRRMVYQGELNTVVTAEPDGSFKRVLFDGLANRTLQGIYWLRDGRFLAYYYGAYGDPVLYFTADVNGQTLSEAPENADPSLITPGASPDGARIVLAAEVGGVTGYYLKRAAYDGLDLLFEAEPPGNNWPGPLFRQDEDGTTVIYAALPVEGQARLACFNLQSRQLHDLSPLPLRLTGDARGRWWLSPDNRHVALAADGIGGGLWLVSLDELPACE
ncbi:MAG: hypothetical protein DWB42_18795 [Chloroflexi bacterium]|nr:hypothetical protein [Chloroflexota bacterium]MDL1885987.1 hypothetical protein [Anaerolineae bacterium CFX8]